MILNSCGSAALTSIRLRGRAVAARSGDRRTRANPRILPAVCARPLRSPSDSRIFDDLAQTQNVCEVDRPGTARPPPRHNRLRVLWTVGLRPSCENSPALGPGCSVLGHEACDVAVAEQMGRQSGLAVAISTDRRGTSHDIDRHDDRHSAANSVRLFPAAGARGNPRHGAFVATVAGLSHTGERPRRAS
jgi:hypothetical protein